jgi:23S rRNA G2445 N2-methylase RlmL
MSLFVTAAAGTEVVLRNELRELGLRGVRADRGGVRVPGGREQAATICLRSRIAVRVLVPFGTFECRSEDDLYDGVAELEWERFVDPDRTLAVTSVARDSRLTHTGYIAQRTKDAIVDRQRRLFGRRSSVDRKDPDVAVFVHLSRDEASVFLDASGQSLHQRGWRAKAGAAPLKETLAAAILRLSGWDRASPLVDPMCGSGTFPIEADLWARGVPPQPPERVFGLERWADFDGVVAARMRVLRERAREPIREEGPPCRGSDTDASAVAIARENAKVAGSQARFAVRDVADLRLDAPGQVVVNPPYGERLEASWPHLAAALSPLEGQRISVLLPADGPLDLLSRAPETVHRLWNGPLECRLVTWSAR